MSTSNSDKHVLIFIGVFVVFSLIGNTFIEYQSLQHSKRIAAAHPVPTAKDPPCQRPAIGAIYSYHFLYLDETDSVSCDRPRPGRARPFPIDTVSEPQLIPSDGNGV